MKKTDIAMIVLIASVSILVAYFVASSVFGGFSGQSAKVKTIQAIDSSIVQPDPSIFNSSAINPSVQVQIDGTQASTTGTQ
jgi:hypothetical protein